MVKRQILWLGKLNPFKICCCFFPPKKIRPSERVSFEKKHICVLIEANAFECRVFAQRQCALRDFAIRNLQGISVPAFGAERPLVC